MYNFLCQVVLIFPLYILLTRRINTFLSEAIDTFWAGATRTVWHIKSQTEAYLLRLGTSPSCENKF